MKVIIAAAGTGGHINPGIAIANQIEKENPGSDIRFIATGKKLEEDLISKAGYKSYAINANGFSKELSIDNIKRTIKTIRGFKEAKKILKEFKPDVVIGTGGYICGAVISGAHKLKIPNLNSRPQWNYVKLVTVEFLNGNKIASDYIEKVISIYENGITFWHHPENIGNYALPNNPS